MAMKFVVSIDFGYVDSLFCHVSSISRDLQYVLANLPGVQ